MSVQAITWAWDWATSGDNGYIVTHQYNFAPINALVQTSISTPPPTGTPSLGLSAYGNQPPGSGPKYFNIPPVIYNGGFVGYQPVVYDPNLISVTWMFDLNSQDSQMVGSLLFFHF